MDLTTSLAQALAPSAPPLRKRAMLPAAAPPATVLQLSAAPTPLDPAVFANMLTPANPTGDQRPLWRFRNLVDPVPAFRREYVPSGLSTEAVYGNVLAGLQVGPDAAYARAVAANALRAFDAEAFPSLDGLPGTWRPVYPDPSDWTRLGDSTLYQDLAVDLTREDGDGDAAYAAVGQDQGSALSWRVAGHAPTPLDPFSRVERVTCKALVVQLQRPWLDLGLFSAGAWTLPGQPAGYVSSGSLQQNDGVLPLLPTSLVVAHSVRIEGAWGQVDAARIATAPAGGLSLGPFVVPPQDAGEGALASPAPQVMGWVSALVPRAP